MSSLCSTPDKLDKETNHEENDDFDEEPATEADLFVIDHKSLPYIFRYNYSALQQLRMSNAADIPKLAHDIFAFFQDKLIVRRYSEGGKYPNRMKYEEKVKFLMRAFDHRKNSTTPDPERKKEKFNRQKQIEFFSRPEVRRYFLIETDNALKRKRIQNDRRIKDLEDCIEMALTLYEQEPERAIRIFEQKIKRKQLPWTDNMFADMEDFSKHIYYRFTRMNEEIDKDVKTETIPAYEEKQQYRENQDYEEEDPLNEDEFQNFMKFENRSQRTAT